MRIYRWYISELKMAAQGLVFYLLSILIPSHPIPPSCMSCHVIHYSACSAHDGVSTPSTPPPRSCIVCKPGALPGLITYSNFDVTNTIVTLLLLLLLLYKNRLIYFWRFNVFAAISTRPSFASLSGKVSRAEMARCE